MCIRDRPNTPAEIREGITGVIKSNSVTSSDVKLAEKVFNSLGSTLWINDEKLMDAVTAISGSGPAYIFYIAETLILAARKAGLSKKSANLLVSHMIKGSGSLLIKTTKTIAELREEVTSPGGTTEAAIKAVSYTHLTLPTILLV